MKIKRFMKILVFAILISSVCYAQQKPIFILGQARIDPDNKCVFYPELKLSETGKWSNVEKQEIWRNQEFVLFSQDHPEITNTKIKLASQIKNYPVVLNYTSHFKTSVSCWAFYSSPKKFKLNGHGKNIRAKATNVTVSNFLKNNSAQKNDTLLLKKLIKIDWTNIKKDLTAPISQDVFDVLKGDLNGDKIPDYVAVVGKNEDILNEDSSEKKEMAVIIYLSQNRKYSRIILREWKQDEWPRLLFLKDINGDQKEELFLISTDGDLSIPSIYSWFGEQQSMRLIYESSNELWNG